MDDGLIDFHGQTAIVTGAGHGLGRSHALALAERGAAVVCNDIDDAAARATVSSIAERGGRAVAETSSVASPDGGAAIVEAALEAFGSIEVVVNNAGQLRNAPFADMSAEDFREVLDTHLVGAFHLTQCAYRHMVTAGYGRIVFTSSSALLGSPWQANYAAAKGGLVGLSHVVAAEGAPHGITANVIMPMALTAMGGSGPPPYSPDELRAVTEALRPLARHLTVENVSPLVVHLASRHCTLTRQTFLVGGGHVARVVVGVTRGWYADDLVMPSPEEVAAHLDEAGDLTGLTEPRSMNDATRSIGDRLPPAR
ncbi:MAG: SDR family oxidoreductase [Actinomycetota bacterium]|nr:SDR family oxidoreductase [Actinomycetota bacterium]